MYREKHWQLLDMDIPMACRIRKMALHSWRVTSLLCPMKSVQKSLAPQAHVVILHPMEWSLSKLLTYVVNKDQLTHAVEIVEVKKPVNIGERLCESFQWRSLTIGNIDAYNLSKVLSDSLPRALSSLLTLLIPFSILLPISKFLLLVFHFPL